MEGFACFLCHSSEFFISHMAVPLGRRKKAAILLAITAQLWIRGIFPLATA